MCLAAKEKKLSHFLLVCSCLGCKKEFEALIARASPPVGAATGGSSAP